MGRRAMWACRSAARDGAAGGARSGAPTLPRLWLVQEHTGVPQSARDLLSGGFNRHDGPSFLNPFRALSRALWRAAVHREAESGGGATSRGARGQLGLSSSAKISNLTSRKSWCILIIGHSYVVSASCCCLVICNKYFLGARHSCNDITLRRLHPYTVLPYVELKCECECVCEHCL